MQINRIQATVRPRNPWESIDLGFRLVQFWWKPLCLLWLTCLFPIALVIYLPLYEEIVFAGWIIWWLKPFFDRLLLHFLSRALFGEPLTPWQLWKALPTLLTTTHLFWGLTIERIGMARSFRLPVWQLEELDSYARSHRLQLLQRQTVNTAQWLTLVCLNFEQVIYFSLFGLLYLMMPTTVDLDFKELVFGTSTLTPLWVRSCHILFNLIALGIVETLYVAGGFALYLNRRTHLEGWDIELGFRRLAERRQGRV